MKHLLTTFKFLLLTFLTSSSVYADGNSKPAEAEITNTTTVVIPVTRDIFAFTDRPDRKHEYFTADQFASLWAQTADDSYKIDPPNAVMT
ncbi:MAG: hypothetical protein NZ730_09150 [Porticoccaceae bacterium]|nr:hypothetical protein [Porticoccaceae bacterium]